ncbi:11142_t:CDS:1, partial [Racocetra persica]
NKRIIKNQFLEADKQFLGDDKQSLEDEKEDKKSPNIVQKHQEHNKYTSKAINMQEIIKALSKMTIVSNPVDSVEIPKE